MTFLFGISYGPILRSVLGGVTIVPLRYGVASLVLGRGAFQLAGEGEPEAVRVHMAFHSEQRVGSSETYSLQAAVTGSACLPAGRAHYVKLAVARIKGPAHGAGKEFAG